MGWVRQKPPPKISRHHSCLLPVHEVNSFRNEPTGTVGDLWRCDVCGELWRITYIGDRLTWQFAWWWQRIRYRNHNTQAS